MIMGAIGLVAGVTGAMVIMLMRGSYKAAPMPAPVFAPEPPPAVAKVFSPEVQYWAPKIMEWSAKYGVDPNILATVIQIESCGDHMAGSSAGAQGLFQVMPFHFSEGENMHDPDTNARRGIDYLKGGLERSDGHIGLAMAAGCARPGFTTSGVRRSTWMRSAAKHLPRVPGCKAGSMRAAQDCVRRPQHGKPPLRLDRLYLRSRQL
jgi:soluble lytic murein transglycosylase-like protein